MTNPSNLNALGYYKAAQTGLSLITATYYNVHTRETLDFTVRDYDYSDCSRDNDPLYYDPIDPTAQRMYLHDRGLLLAGDMVTVIKGRKVPVGTVARITRIRPIYDRFGRHVADYADLDNGKATNVNNLELN